MNDSSSGLNSPCIKCSESDSDLKVECFICKQNCHIKCNKIPKTAHTYYNKNSLELLGFRWICGVCTEKASSNAQSLDNITTKLNEIDKIKEDLENIKTTITNGFEFLENRVNKKVDSYAAVASNKNCESNKIISSIEKNLNAVKDNIDTVKDNIDTVKENIDTKIDTKEEELAKKRKKNNVIIFNIPETKSGDDETDYKEDLMKIQTILSNKVSIQKEDVKAVFRIGNSSEDKTRPIIMKMGTYGKKLELLKLRNLTYTISNRSDKTDTNGNDDINDGNNDIDDEDSNETVFKIYLNHDLTKKEQAEHKRLRDERNKTNEDKKKPFRKDPQKYWGNF